MSSKRSPQTAAKRAREEALREKRERKALKKQAVALAKLEPESVEVDPDAISEDDALDGEQRPAAALAGEDGLGRKDRLAREDRGETGGGAPVQPGASSPS